MQRGNNVYNSLQNYSDAVQKDTQTKNENMWWYEWQRISKQTNVRALH